MSPEQIVPLPAWPGHRRVEGLGPGNGYAVSPQAEDLTDIVASARAPPCGNASRSDDE